MEGLVLVIVFMWAQDMSSQLKESYLQISWHFITQPVSYNVTLRRVCVQVFAAMSVTYCGYVCVCSLRYSAWPVFVICCLPGSTIFFFSPTHCPINRTIFRKTIPGHKISSWFSPEFYFIFFPKWFLILRKIWARCDMPFALVPPQWSADFFSDFSETWNFAPHFFSSKKYSGYKVNEKKPCIWIDGRTDGHYDAIGCVSQLWELV